MKPKNQWLLIAAISLLWINATSAQSAGDWGIGIQLGSPSGLTLKHYNPGGMSFDALAAWDLDDFFFLNIHGLWEQNISASPNLNFFYGPGGFIGFLERNKRFDSDDELRLGVSGTFGLNLYVERFEIYLQLTPRLAVIEETDGSVGGGVGFRFYL